MSNTAWWYLTRASGLTAWVFLTLTLVWGALSAGRMVAGKGARRWLDDLHPYLATIGLVTLILHVVGAVADSTVGLTWLDTVLPFTAAWNPVGIAAGVLALWLLVAVEATSLLRRHLARTTWRQIHLLSYAGAIMATMHAILAGTDLRTPVVAAAGFAAVVAAAAISIRRWLGPEPPRRQVVAPRSGPAAGAAPARPPLHAWSPVTPAAGPPLAPPADPPAFLWEVPDRVG